LHYAKFDSAENPLFVAAGAGVIGGFGGGIVNNGTIIANGVNPLTIAINDAYTYRTDLRFRFRESIITGFGNLARQPNR
jgi:hypothetical protein